LKHVIFSHWRVAGIEYKPQIRWYQNLPKIKQMPINDINAWVNLLILSFLFTTNILKIRRNAFTIYSRNSAFYKDQDKIISYCNFLLHCTIHYTWTIFYITNAYIFYFWYFVIYAGNILLIALYEFVIITLYGRYFALLDQILRAM
jgi:hypothetical protein